MFDSQNQSERLVVEQQEEHRFIIQDLPSGTL